MQISTRWIIALLTIFQSRFFLTNRALDWLLKFIVVVFKYFGNYSENLTEVASELPHSLYLYNQSVENIMPVNNFVKKAVCMRCETLYNFKDCFKTIGLNKIIMHCTNKPFKKECGELLMKEVISSSGNKKVYPHKIYCFVSLISSLQNLLLRTGFATNCESTRNNFSESGLSDVYDGSIWKDFLTIDNAPFLSQSNCYGLLLNIDWLQPYKHTQHSVGVIYMVILNLPRSIRFKRENVILCGVIPGPNEPSLTINSYLAPIVSDLEKLWSGVELQIAGESSKTMFKCALLGIACDLPAARKVCGFLSYTANLGCSRCLQQFSRGYGIRNCYSDFNRENWKMRTNESHRDDVKLVLAERTITARSKKESQVGCRYSVLLDLSYFRPIEMLLIDPMHNLYLGTAKHFARDIWIDRKILSSNGLEQIEVKLKSITSPQGLGRLPSSINYGYFLTADQWKNWTLYFSLICLNSLLPAPHLECWRKFVLACRKLYKFSITLDDIKIADELLLRFCKQTVEIYGDEAISPNMHMHCHLSSCIKEFGPLHTFWLFPFERYNGILEEQPTNNRSVELQLMRRFQKDNASLNLQHEVKSWPEAEKNFGVLLDGDNDLDSTAFANVTKPGPKSTLGSFTTESIPIMKRLYAKLYPDFESQILDSQVYVSYTFRKYSTIQWHGKTLTSNLNKNAKNCLLMALPHFNFSSSGDTGQQSGERLAEVDYFLTHSMILPDNPQPLLHLFACVKWPMMHSQHEKYGNPVKVWYRNLYEHQQMNKFLLVSNISSRVVFALQTDHGIPICATVPVIDA